MTPQQRVEQEVIKALTKLSQLFVPGMKLTFIGRFPDNNDADFLISSDSIEEIENLLKRSRQREEQIL